jgi:hypothetical protein
VNDTDDFSAAWTRAQRAMPAGWRLDSLRCASTSLDVSQRSERWLANAHGPDGAVEQVEEADPVAALNSLVERVRRR